MNKKYVTAFLIVISFFGIFSNDASASNTKVSNTKEVDKDYYSMSNPVFQEITDPLILNQLPSAPALPKYELNLSLDETPILETIINLGKQLWQLIEAGKPVVNIETDNANALPEGIKGWQSLAGWQTPVSKVYQMSSKNGYGSTVINFSYRLLYTYGGNLNGRGRYLTHITVIPAQIDVAWGYRFSAQVQIPSITNAGTVEDPVGAAEIMIKWTVDTVLKHSEGSTSYYVKGDGTFVDLSGSTP